MKITKARLKEIIKEELDMMSEGSEVDAILAMLDPETIEAAKIIAQAAGKMAPTAAAAGATAFAADQLRQAVSYLKGGKPEGDDLKEQQVSGDVTRAAKKLDSTTGLDSILASINTRDEFVQVLNLFIQKVAKEKLKPQDVKAGVKKVAASILKAK